MKKSLLFFCLCLILGSISAQSSFSLTMNDTILTGDITELYNFEGLCVNSNCCANVSITQSIVSTDFPTGWTIQMCNPNGCFSSNTPSNTFTLSPSNNGHVIFNFFIAGIMGEGSAQVRFANANDSTDFVDYTLFAQISDSTTRFSFSPSKRIDIEADANDFSSEQVYVVNETSEALTLGWKQLSNSLNPGWSVSLCDLGACFPFVPDSNIMNTTTVGGNAYFISHITFNGIEDSGAFQLFVYEVGDENNGDTLTFHYSATLSTAIEGDLHRSFSRIFPNPSSGIFTIEMQDGQLLSAWTLIDIQGKVLNHQAIMPNPSWQLDLTGLAKGNYILQLHTQSGLSQLQRITISQ